MMRNIVIILCTIVLGIHCSSSKSKQMVESSWNAGEFSKAWTKVDSLDNKGLYQSALDQVLSIKQRASDTGAHNHVVKALYHEAKYLNLIEEDGMLKSIAVLESEATEKLPAGHQAIVRSVLAGLYYQYASQNQYKIQGRTLTEEVDDKIDTWSLARIIKKSNELYLSSVSPDAEAAGELHDYEFLIEASDQELSEAFTLRTLLMKRAVDHFRNSRNLIVAPVNAFRLIDDAAFADTDVFREHRFDTTDEAAYTYQALVLYQQLEKEIKNENLLYQVVIERLQYVHQIHQSADKQGLYRSALQAIADHTEVPGAEQKRATYQLALSYYHEGLKYSNEFDPGLKDAFLKAASLLQDETQGSPKDQVDLAIDALIDNINVKDLQLSTELVYLPDEAVLYYIKYRNVDKVNFKLIKTDQAFMQEIRQTNRQKIKERLMSMPSIRNWSVDTAADDYNTHASELLLDPLRVGEYILIASSDDVFSYGFFHVSNLSYRVQTGNAYLDYAVTHRQTGEPLSGVKLTFYNQQYNRNKYTRIPIKTVYTNQEGRVKSLKSVLNLKDSKSNRQYRNQLSIGVTLELQDDVLDLNQLHHYNDRYDNRKQAYIHVLSDRKLYRPGQTVYIKGIALEADEYGDTDQVISNEKLSLILRDANGKEIRTKELRTNEYGSVNAELLLPAGGLNGQYSIELSSGRAHGYHSITVEEYKRPRFAVNLDLPAADYKLGDRVSVSGDITMFSGGAVSGAEVLYRVSRRARYHHYHAYGRMPQQQAQEEIAYGQVSADQDGTFSIDFQLKEPSHASERSIYSYEVTAEATDISGETQSGSVVISASRQRLFLSLSQSGIVDVSELDSLRLLINNIAGYDVSMVGSYKIEKLQEPEVYKRPKYWGTMDTSLLSQESYEKVPADYQLNDASYQNWEVQKEVATGQINANGSYDIPWPESESAGVYKISVTAEDGTKEIFYLRINDESTHQYTKSELLHFHLDQREYRQGETATLTIASAFSGVNVTYDIEKRGKMIKSDRLEVSNTHQSIQIPIAADDIDFIIHISCIHQNRSYLFQEMVRVPQHTKELDISVHSFRSTLLPGEKVEDWTIQVKNKKGQNEIAEIAASIYDASLDELSSYAFEWRDLSKANYYSHFRTDVVGFTAQYFSQIHDRSSYSTIRVDTPYPSLNTFGIFQLNGRLSGAYKKRALRRGADAGAPTSSTPAPEAEAMMSEEADMAYKGSAQVSNFTGDEATEEPKLKSNDWSSIRTNLKETVFFYPQLYSDADGQAELKFTMGEALTRWKLQLFAHTPKAASGVQTMELYTKKDVMIYPNVSRFARVGDKLRLSGKVVNLTDQAMTATVRLQLADALSDADLTSTLLSSEDSYDIQLGPNESKEIEWWTAPDATVLNGLIYRMKVEAGNQSDGEEGYLPVLTNQILVTESLPLYVPSMSTRSYNFQDLKDALSSETAEVLKYSIEHVSNPAWYAFQALPYLSAVHHEGIAQLAERYFANQVGLNIMQANPVIKRVIDQWRRDGSDQSQLLKNQDLKSALIEETPWLQAALSETESMQKLAVFFDENQLQQSLASIIDEITGRQNTDGGFSWFPGRRSSLFMTAQVLDKIAKLEAIKIEHELASVKSSAIRYIDAELEEYFANYNYKKSQEVSAAMLSTLFIRSSFIEEQPLSQASVKHLDKIKEHWTELHLSDQATLALILHRMSSDVAAIEIYQSIRERELSAESKGTYWKHDGAWGNQSAVDRQVLMISLYHAMDAEQAKLDALKTWLLVNKQANHWTSSSATAAAVYALLIDGDAHQSKWLTSTDESQVIVGTERVVPESADAGSLYFRKDYAASEITEELAEIKIENQTDQINWGSAYVQYMEDIDKIAASKSDQLSLTKEIYKEVLTDEGPQLIKLGAADQLSLGDKLVVKLICQTDRPIEYVHIKDYRASGTEPTQTLSQYRSQDGLSYYEVTRDLSSNFFISHMSRGTYVLEYDLRVNLEGTYSSGIATVQCLYAPALTAHSNSVNLKIGQ